MSDNTRLIDQYLQNELNTEEKQSFEKRLSSDKELQKELMIQQKIMQGIQNAGHKEAFSKAIKKHVWKKRMIKWTGIILSFLVILLIAYLLKNNFISDHTGDNSKANDTSLVAQQFELKTDRDTVIETKGGIVFAIPANAFNTNTKNILLSIKEALMPYEIMKEGLSTMSGDTLLRTAGMFYINGYADGKELSLAKKIAVSIPADTLNPQMMLFDGKENSNAK